MKKYNFLVLCAMGMSSSILVKKIKQTAEEEGIDIEIGCYFSSNFKELDFSGVDIILLAPQVRNQIKEVEKYVSDYNVAVMQIDMQQYGLMEGKKIFHQALEIIGEKKRED